jgi:hypothetical protein
MTVDQCRTFVKKKDDDNWNLFRRTPGFDLYTERDVFNIALDNTTLIAAPTRTAADAGIRSFAPVLRAAVEACHGTISTATFSQVAEAHATPTDVKWLYA